MKARTAILILLALGVFIPIVALVTHSIVEAQNPPVVPRYSPSIPTPGLTGVAQELSDVRSEVLELRSVVAALITNQQDVIVLEMAYLNSLDHASQFTKQAWIDGEAGIPSRGYILVSDLLAQAQAALDAWEALRDSLIP